MISVDGAATPRLSLSPCARRQLLGAADVGRRLLESIAHPPDHTGVDEGPDALPPRRAVPSTWPDSEHDEFGAGPRPVRTAREVPSAVDREQPPEVTRWATVFVGDLGRCVGYIPMDAVHELPRQGCCGGDRQDRRVDERRDDLGLDLDHDL